VAGGFSPPIPRARLRAGRRAMPLSEPLVNVLAGGLAGAVETSLTYPLDLAKTRQQLSTSRSGSVPSVLLEVYSRQGLGGLYRGLAAPLVSEVPRRAIKFTLNGLFKEQLCRLYPSRSLSADVGLAAAAGAAAGASETLLHTPFEVVKIRLQATGGAALGSPLEAARGILRVEGLAGLYAGLEAYALRQAVWNGGFFGFIGLGKAALPPPRGGSKAGRDFLLGLLAGSAATCLNNPLDVAKSRIQGASAGGHWSVSVTMGVARSEGVRGLCKGLPARLYRSAPGHGLLYMGFEFFAGLLRSGF